MATTLTSWATPTPASSSMRRVKRKHLERRRMKKRMRRRRMKRSLKSMMRRMKRRLADGQWWSGGAELAVFGVPGPSRCQQHKPRAVRSCQRMLRG
ncbi:hypothetical protein DV515_00001368 [Chloebia gouldiae]|uniref:Uncharacterized protein n=1 Tax=Chloebia gouldiae TaxID=44316 RepID=A0A3L8SYL2_CHLGU|nr:hypothetical protein DV515_00001368 [Chloebia gouldiae]